jgi:hypothetical protein
MVVALATGCAASASPSASSKKDRASEPARPAEPPAKTPVTPVVQAYGAKVRAGAADHDLGKLLADPDAYASLHVTVEGVVRQVCQRRGCWLELASDAGPDALGCRVVSEQHAFFVPRDSAGSRAKVEGTVEVRTVSAEQVAHMESEGGRFPRKLADGTAREVRISAVGVELAR